MMSLKKKFICINLRDLFLPNQEQKVCKLVKSLHGLKQTHKQWHEKFDKAVNANGFKIHDYDKCVYSKFYKNQGVITYLYVDDMLIFRTNCESIENTKIFLSFNFDIKDLGIANVILGIRIIRNENGLILNQSHYVENVLKRFNQFNCKLVSIPFDDSMKLYHKQ